jgi:hypothetical protein
MGDYVDYTLDRGVEVRAAMLGGAELARRIPVAAGRLAMRHVLAREAPSRRPVDRLLVEGMAEVE